MVISTIRTGVLIAGLLAATSSSWGQAVPIEVSTTESLEIFLEATLAFHEGQYEKADDLLRETIGLEPDYTVAHAYLAAVDRLLYRNPAPRLEQVRHHIVRRPRAERILAEAIVLFADSRFEECLTALRNILAEYPDDRYVASLLGITLNELDRPALSVEQLTTLLRNDPGFTPAYYHLGIAYLSLHRPLDAERVLKTFLSRMPGSSSAHDAYAEVLARKGELERALGHLARAVLLEPRFAAGWLHMGDILRAAGNESEAQTAYENALEAGDLYGARFVSTVDARLSGHLD